MDFIPFSWRDLLDITLVTILIYRIILLVKGTRALSALSGLLLLILIYLGAQYLGLYTLGWLLENLFGSLFLVIIILFHDDIRQALSRVGVHNFWKKKKEIAPSLIDNIIWSCQHFAKRRIGALIVFEREIPLTDMMQEGVMLDAILSKELLLTLFYPMTALHDGAVIIRRGRIAAAGCILPLAQMDRQAFGTRHRAALGVAEVSDAFVIVVSEERGEISMVSRGKLVVVTDIEQLIESLRDVLDYK